MKNVGDEGNYDFVGVNDEDFARRWGQRPGTSNLLRFPGPASKYK